MKGVLITGSGKRIGASIAKDLSKNGWHVIIHYHNSGEEALGLREKILSDGGQASLVQADLEQINEVTELLTKCEKIAPVTCLINNASYFSYDTIHTATSESLEKNMRINLFAPIFLSQEFHKICSKDNRQGCIINILDNKVKNLNPDYFSYTLSKVALDGLTKMLALALSPVIRVCGIAPGITLLSGKQTQENFEKAHKNNPLKQGCRVEDIILAVHFILNSTAYNGDTIVIDGGQSLTAQARDVAFL
jgi:NAD(P)-dependent dehydrogenase (short-subunit alcohol dehydrogenase family)